MSQIGKIVCRCGSKFLSTHISRHSGQSWSVFKRFKYDDAKPSGVVVEKEKKNRAFNPRLTDWNRVPEKVHEFKEVFREVFRAPKDQKLVGRQYKENEVLYYFRDNSDLEHWYVHTDKWVGGKSWAEFVQGENGMTASFRGYVSQRIPRHLLPSSHDRLEERHTYSGYACLQTKPFLSFFNREDWTSIMGYNIFEIRLRGDGRKYMFEVECELSDENFMYTIPIFTRGGPEWEVVKIPYAKLIMSRQSRFTVSQESLDVSRVVSFRFLLSDMIQGPFQLEIDYIGLIKDSTESIAETDYYDPYTGMNSILGTW